MTAPVVYKDLMLIISDEKSVIAINKSGEYTCGSGLVAERIKTMKTADPHVVKGIDVAVPGMIGVNELLPTEMTYSVSSVAKGMPDHHPRFTSILDEQYTTFHLSL